MTFGAGVIWVGFLLPIVGTLAMILLQVALLRRIEAVLNEKRQKNA
ncbi:MAG: hypothetical protein K2X73_06660 [Sphingomonas sp.]|nr:hypothetical protein [Sphingomonas sp.]MBX9881640.1 hypothetical protein [Sphingomonas sp.]